MLDFPKQPPYGRSVDLPESFVPLSALVGLPITLMSCRVIIVITILFLEESHGILETLVHFTETWI